jgi:hypothetical protein
MFFAQSVLNSITGQPTVTPSATTTKQKVNTNLDKIADYFPLPISYNANKTALDQHIVNDLELTVCIDPSATSIYSHICAPSHCLGKKMLTQIPLTYTTDKAFLKDTQRLLKSHSFVEEIIETCKKEENGDHDFQRVVDIYDEIKNDLSFRDKYYYLDWDHLLFLNKCGWFMQFMSLYNLSSPLLSLFLPIIMLIIPFFIIKMKGLSLTMTEYIDVLKQIIANHALGKVFTKFHEADTQQKAYLVVSAAFYVFSIYQNVLVCTRFYNNMTRVYSFLSKIQQYLAYTTVNMDRLIYTCATFPSYTPFINVLQGKLTKLKQLQSRLECIDNLHDFAVSFNTMKQIGYVMTTFYEIYESDDTHNVLMYSFGFNGYADVIRGLQENLKNKHLNFCNFSLKKGRKGGKAGKGKEVVGVGSQKTAFKNAYYPALIGSTAVKNSYDLSKHLIITGPNASGKTTTLKTTLINILVSQQFGCGCYESATVHPYKYMHCYLNIPDTIGRDSLLQAEARRCKCIIDAVKESDHKDTHFCIFDELYSGTNPEEAVISAYVVMNYLAKHKNVTTMLTTHYADLCKKLEKKENMKNCHMKVLKTDDNFEYTYLLEEGISIVKGGVKVLMDMNYPQEIIDNANKTASN